MRTGSRVCLALQMKDECAKRSKVCAPDGTRLTNPGVRILTVQTFEDGFLARVLTAENLFLEITDTTIK